MKRISRLVGLLPIPDRWAVPLQYRLELGRWPNLKRPTTFNEHICAAKLRADGRALARYVDKHSSRITAAAALGADCLVPLVGIWGNAWDVPVELLPECALKCTHASHAGLRIAGVLGDGWSLRDGHQVCGIMDVRWMLNRWMRRSWYLVARERPYHYIKPRVMGEQWIDGAVDYKVMVFHGAARAIQRHGMEDGKCAIDLYDVRGEAMGAGKVGFERSYITAIDEALAARLCAAAERVAEQISPAQDYVRVDFLVDPTGHLYFGEITFYDSAGLRDFEPNSVNYLLGGWM